MATRTLTEIAAFEAAKRADLRLATQELVGALVQMTVLLRRCLESTEVASGPALKTLEREYELASEYLLKLANCAVHIAATLNVNPSGTLKVSPT